MRGVGEGGGGPVRRLLSIALIVVVGGGATVLAAAGGGDSKGTTYKVVFDNAFGLVEGGDFRVGGVTAGQTTAFEATDDTPPKAEVSVEITEPGFADFRNDASCEIRPQSLIGEYYVDCQPGKSEEKLGEGGTVPVERTQSTIPTDLVNNVLRRPYRERFRLIITELGTGLAGRPQDLQEVLQRAHPGLRETSRTLRILGDQNQVIENFIRDSDTVVAELEARKQDVSRFIEEAGETAEITATRREQLRQTFGKLPGFLSELRPTMARLGELTDEQMPLLVDAERAAPSLDAFLARLGPFSEASRPAVRSLGKTSDIGRRAFERGEEEVDALRRAADKAAPTARPLRQLLESLDDRRRAISDEPSQPGPKDPRALIEGPPETDPSTNNGGEGGFTGFESFWNYPFWQSLSFNAFDDVGHVLRLGITETECSEYTNRSPMYTEDPAERAELEEFLDRCNQWLGPNQPGINAPDPTRPGSPAAVVAQQAGRPARRAGERRGPGEPEAGPLPGQRDISRPQIVTPPVVRDLLDPLRRAPQTVPQVPDTGTGAGAPRDTQILDYLLAP